MINTRLYLIIGTSLSLIPTLAYAQCVPTQDCETLGYTETSCNGGRGIKCPFGNKWACIKTDEECLQAACEQLDFKYVCEGEGYVAGVGKACGGSFQSCSCVYGYELTDGICMKLDAVPVACAIGTLYYDDGKCYDKKVDSKNLLGVVIYSNGSGGGWIMSVKKQSDASWWGPATPADIPALGNFTSTPNDLQSSCVNTDILVQAGSVYNAAWVARNTSVIGTPAGKQWCLPSAGLLATINQESFKKIDAALVSVGGDVLEDLDNLGGGGTESIWTSTEASSEYAWYWEVNSNGPASHPFFIFRKDSGRVVRSVMDF